MWLFKKIQSSVLRLLSVVMLSISLIAISSANEVDEINEHSYPLFSTSISMLIYPFQEAPELTDPMNDEVDHIERSIAVKKGNVLFDKLLAFNDSFQRFTQNFIKNANTHKVHTGVTQDIKTSDKNEINCQTTEDH